MQLQHAQANATDIRRLERGEIKQLALLYKQKFPKVIEMMERQG